MLVLVYSSQRRVLPVVAAVASEVWTFLPNAWWKLALVGLEACLFAGRGFVSSAQATSGLPGVRYRSNPVYVGDLRPWLRRFTLFLKSGDLSLTATLFRGD